jgi:predicted tellurium resistance membrane protein TerC
LSAFWGAVLRIELVNLAFSIDSILVAVAVSPKLWVVVTGGILGIVAMRLVVGQMIAIIERYPALVDGAFVIIAWVGMKLIIEYLHAVGLIPFEIPQWLSLGLIIVIFIAAFIWAQQVERKRLTKTEEAAQGLYDGEAR